MSRKLIDQLIEIIEAERLSEAWRSEFGDDAEPRCAALLAELSRRDPRRSQLEHLRRALRAR